jgi:hypothetical protein
MDHAIRNTSRTTTVPRLATTEGVATTEGRAMMEREKMIPVPEKLLRDYVTGMGVNHKYMKSRIINILEEYDNQPRIMSEEDEELTPYQKIQIIFHAYQRKEFHLKTDFEEDFILDKKDTKEIDLRLSEKQLRRLDELWRKYKRTVPEL